MASDSSSESKGGVSKKQAKKDALKAEKLRRKKEEAAASTVSKNLEDDPLVGNYGDVPMEELQSKAVTDRNWIEVGSLDSKLTDGTVLIRGVVQTVRAVGKKIAFLVVRQSTATVQCVLTVTEELVSTQMVKYATSLCRESIVDVEGVVTVPTEPIKGATQQVSSPIFSIFNLEASFGEVV